MQDPHQIADAVVRSWYAGPYNLHHEFDQEIADVAEALASYGDARAAQERARAAQLAQITGTAHTYSAAEHASGFAASDIVARIVTAIRQPGA